MAKKNKIPKPRNPFAVAAVLRSKTGGAHGKTKKAQRRADKMALRSKY